MKIIGESSYDIEAGVDLKNTKNRPPTPTESLTSLGKQPYMEKLTNKSDDDDDEDEEHEEHEFISTLPVTAKIFVEHLFVTFKKRVVVGVAKAVMECLCHFKSTQEIINKTEYLSKFYPSITYPV